MSAHVCRFCDAPITPTAERCRVCELSQVDTRPCRFVESTTFLVVGILCALALLWARIEGVLS